MPTEAPFTYDPEAAENGWRATTSLRAAVGPSPLPSVDAADVAVLGLRVSRDLLKAENRAPFEALPAAHFDHDLVDRIEPASWALWYANTRRLSLEATESGGRVQASTLARAFEVKARMMRVCEYMLADHPKAGREVADIRSGTGHKDLATDLTRLASLYEAHADLLGGAGAHYDPADAVAAKASAAALLFEIGETEAKALREAKDDLARAFAVLQTAYDRLARWSAAIWDDDDRMPSLFSVRPSGGPRSRATGEPVADPGVTGTT